MSNSILTRDGNYLQIFNSAIRVNKNLKKWKQAESETSTKEDDPDAISLSNFLNLSNRDFNIYLNKNVKNTFKKNGWLVEEDGIEISKISSFKANSAGKQGVIKNIAKFIYEYINSSNEKVVEEVYEFDALQFFEKVKLTCKESKSNYELRIKPYLLALKQAQDMGQQALVDSLAQEMFTAKYESILHAEGFDCKISEEQVVEFVKRAESGIHLDYIENFARPIPEDVIKIKLKADDLLVFDNYCVMYYDKEAKSYKQTEAEKEAERRKRTDPILFGLISGSKNLYYVADWIDEYCDLTLEEFLKVSGLEKKAIEIPDDIKLM